MKFQATCWGIGMLLLTQSVMAQTNDVINLYAPGRIPYARMKTETPKLTVYKALQPNTTRTAVIVCSGGGYGDRMNRTEGVPACEMLAKAGITAFLLDYRVPNEQRMEDKETVPLTDAQRALQYVRENAATWGLDNNRIGIMGFSAGGHLAATVATRFNETSLDNRKQISLRPSFVVLIYPVISFADSLTHEDSRERLIGPGFDTAQIRAYSAELNVTSETPPAFVTTALDDEQVKIENSLYFIAALQQHKVPVETFLYRIGRHGFGVNNARVDVQWIDACMQWILKDKWKTP